MNDKSMFRRLPKRAVFCFAPICNAPEQPQDILMVFDGASRVVPTHPAARNPADAEASCNLLNAPLDIAAQQSSRMTAQSLQARCARSGATLHQGHDNA